MPFLRDSQRTNKLLIRVERELEPIPPEFRGARMPSVQGLGKIESQRCHSEATLLGMATTLHPEPGDASPGAGSGSFRLIFGGAGLQFVSNRDDDACVRVSEEPERCHSEASYTLKPKA